MALHNLNHWVKRHSRSHVYSADPDKRIQEGVHFFPEEECGHDAVLATIQAHGARPNGILMGSAGSFNLDLIAAGGYAGGILSDINIHQEIAWDHVFAIAAQVYADVQGGIIDPQHRRFVLAERLCMLPELLAAHDPPVELRDSSEIFKKLMMEELDRPGSFLAQDSTADHIMFLAASNALVAITMDVLDREAHESLRADMEMAGAVFDCIHRSNIGYYFRQNRDFYHGKSAAPHLDTYETMWENGALVADAGTMAVAADFLVNEGYLSECGQYNVMMERALDYYHDAPTQGTRRI
ncbi:MAG: hypothetical protein J0L97_09255 [Alphaproteobacteria bacterium]|nr:hypothetical protein [Alphaproteobacteria bacterium]